MAIKYDDKRKTWYVIVYHQGKQYWKRGLESRTLAKKAELEIKLSLENPKRRIKFDELANEFLAHQKTVYSLSTVKTNESRYTTHIKPYLGKKYIDKITPKDIQSLVSILKLSNQGYSNTYINHIIETVSKIYNYAIDMEYCDKNPAKKIKKLKQVKDGLQYFKLDEFQKLYDVISDNYYMVYLECLMFLGIRCGESRALQWSQINFDKNTIHINAHVVDKGGKRRENGRKNNKNYIVHMPKNIRESLLNIYNSEKMKDGFNEDKYVFGFYDSWSYNRIRLRFKKALKEANLEDRKLHSLRHGYASMLANNGATIQELASALGDTLEVTINTYAHMYDDINEKISQRVDNIINNSSFFCS